MREEIIFAGFGGQGVILAGRLICIASMREGMFVSHIPSYGAEMRGGTANCSVIVADKEIAAPLVFNPTVCVVLNKPSLIKFKPKIVEGGLLIYNSSLIDESPDSKNMRVIPVKASELAEKEGNIRAANIIMLGVLVKLKPELASQESMLRALDVGISERYKAMNEINKRAFKKGYSLV